MMKYFRFLALIFFFGMASCQNNDEQDVDTAAAGDENHIIISNNIKYAFDTVMMNGYVAYDSSFTDKRPVVLILPEWWGVGNFVKGRANQLAEMGYLAMVVDLYGNGKYVETPQEATALSAPFYENPYMSKNRFDAALAQIKANPYADTNRIAAIGYCFGGAQVLNYARLGENLNGVVSFHGNLVGVIPEENTILAKILVCHGADDKFVPAEEVALFKKQMDSVGASYQLKSYANATHAFTNPDATATGEKFKIPIAYNAIADTASWADMKAFFKTIF